MNRLLLLVLSLVALGLGACADNPAPPSPRVGKRAQALTTIASGDEETISVNARAIGQTFTVPDRDIVLRRIQLGAGFGGARYQARLYPWDSGSGRPTGSAVWISAPQTADAVLFGTGDVALEAGRAYAFLLAPIDPGSPVFTCEAACIRPNGDTRDIVWRECSPDPRLALENAGAQCALWKPDSVPNGEPTCVAVPGPATCAGPTAHRTFATSPYPEGAAIGSDLADVDWTTKAWTVFAYDFTFRAELVSAPSIALASSAPSAIWGQSFVLTATLPKGVSGDITFVDQGAGATIGSAPVDGSGAAKLLVPGKSIAVGTYHITAVYPGDANFGTATSAPLTQVVSRTGTTTTLSLGPSPAVQGQAVTLTAIVEASVSSVIPTGKVAFFDSTQLLGTVTLDPGGRAELVTRALTAGAGEVRAVFTPADAAFTSSESRAPYDVRAAATSTTLTSSLNPSPRGGDVSFTARVAAVAPGAGTPAGTVTFTDEATGSSLGTIALDASGMAIVTARAFTLAVGLHTIRATYAGEARYLTSTTTLNQRVATEGVTMALSVAPTPSKLGELVTLTASISGSAGTPTGAITFKDGAAVLTSVGLVKGSASALTAALAIGSHTLTAEYEGDATYAATTATATHHVMGVATVTLTSSRTPSLADESVTFTVKVEGNGGEPTGGVELLEGTTSLGRATLAAGTVTFTPAALTPGSHSLIARYEGDANFPPASSAALVQEVRAQVTPASDAGADPPPVSLSDAGADPPPASVSDAGAQAPDAGEVPAVSDPSSAEGGSSGCAAGARPDGGAPLLALLAALALIARRSSSAPPRLVRCSRFRCRSSGR